MRDFMLMQIRSRRECSLADIADIRLEILVQRKVPVEIGNLCEGLLTSFNCAFVRAISFVYS